MTYAYRIAPHNAIVIERRVERPGARFCFYMTTDSRNEANRILSVLCGVTEGDVEQMEWTQ